MQGVSSGACQANVNVCCVRRVQSDQGSSASAAVLLEARILSVADAVEAISAPSDGIFSLFPQGLNRTSRNQKGSHCEERSDVAIQIISSKVFCLNGWIAALRSQ